MPKKKPPTQSERRAAARHKIARLLREAGWAHGLEDGEFTITGDEFSEDDHVELIVHVQFNLNDLSIEQELALIKEERKR